MAFKYLKREQINPIPRKKDPRFKDLETSTEVYLDYDTKFAIKKISKDLNIPIRMIFLKLFRLLASEDQYILSYITGKTENFFLDNKKKKNNNLSELDEFSSEKLFGESSKKSKNKKEKIEQDIEFDDQEIRDIYDMLESQ